MFGILARELEGIVDQSAGRSAGRTSPESSEPDTPKIRPNNGRVALTRLGDVSR